MRRKIQREDIIKTGLRLIHLQGYHATGIKDITDAMGIPKGSFYNHFESKEAFGLEVLRYYEDYTLERMELLLGEEARHPVERIRRFFEARANDFRKAEDFRFGCLAGNYSSELGDVSPTFAKATFRTLERIKLRIADCLAAAVRAGELPADILPEELAEFITNSWQGSLVKMKASRSAYPLDMFFKYIFDGLLHPLARTAVMP